MLNIDHVHPMIVHFPIALIIVGFIAEIVSLFFRNENFETQIFNFSLIVYALQVQTGRNISGLVVEYELMESRPHPIIKS